MPDHLSNGETNLGRRRRRRWPAVHPSGLEHRAWRARPRRAWSTGAGPISAAARSTTDATRCASCTPRLRLWWWVASSSASVSSAAGKSQSPQRMAELTVHVLCVCVRLHGQHWISSTLHSSALFPLSPGNPNPVSWKSAIDDAFTS